jgi:membrane protease YdiL (CAAX protease family)
METNESKVSRRVAWRHVAAFTLFAYGIAWALWSSLLPSIGDALSTGRTATDLRSGGIVGLGMFAPALAAIVMRLFVSREGLRGSLGPSRRWRYYALAVFGPVILVTFVVVMVSVTGLGDFSPGGPLGIIYAALLLVGVPIGALYAFGEEYGWRGYLLPKLLPLGEVKASLVVALIWAPWHLPVLLAGLNYPGESVFMVLAVFMLSVAALSMLHTRLFVASGASVLVVTFLHGSLNAFSDRLTDAAHLSGNSLIVSGGGVITTALIVIAMTVVYRSKRQAQRLVGSQLKTEETVMPNHGPAAPEQLAS